MSRIRDAARAAYAGWNGWYHQRHWPDDEIAAARKIRAEAVQAEVDMRAQIDHLRTRIRACQQLVDAIDEMIDDEVAP